MTDFNIDHLAKAYQEAALTENRAFVEKKRLQRIADTLLPAQEGKSVAEREAMVRTDETYTTVEDEYIEAYQEAVIAKAKKDAQAARFEYWRTNESTRRAEMKL